MKLADRDLAYDEGFKVYIGRAQFRSSDGTLKFSETWYAEFYLDGKQHRKALGVRTKLHAIKEAQKLADSLASGDVRLTERSKIKLGDVIERYLAWQHLNDRAPKTLEKYEYVLRDRLKPWWVRKGDKPALTFKADDYLAYKKTLADDGYEPKTIADRLMIVRQVETLLDRSVAAEGYVIQAAQAEEPKYLDLSEIDFEALQKAFNKGRKHTEFMKLRQLVEQVLAHLVDLNPTRVDYLEKFQKLIDEYNAGSANTDAIFEQLLKFAQALSEEEKRHVREQLTEEELALFDILTKPRPDITSKEETEVKAVAKALLRTLKNEKLVLDWRNRQQTRAAVKLCIEELLDQLPRAYTPDIYEDKCQAVYQHVYDHYLGAGQSPYAA